MKVIIYSPVKEISHIISKQLTCQGHKCVIFEYLEDLSSLIRNLKKGPDLIILDYLSFNHDLFNIYTYLNKLNKQIPVIFFNDPCLTRSTRAAHWKAILEMTQTKYLTQGLCNYSEIFTTLEKLVESEALVPYIPLLQPPKLFPKNFLNENNLLKLINNDNLDYITSFKLRNNLPNNLFYLLNIFEENKDHPMELSKIIDCYKKDGKKISERSLRVHISNLKSIIRKDEKHEFIIDQDKGTYRLIRILE